MDASTASSPSIVSRTVELSIPQAQIGLFVGDNDISLNKYIIEKSQYAYSRSHGGEVSVVSVSIVIEGDFGETVVVAKCTAENDLLLNIVESNIHFHTKNFNRTKKTHKPLKSNFARLVFKTHIPTQMIGKFIGTSGKHIKALSSLLEQDASDDGIDATSFRVNITEEDANKSSPTRYFEIKNTSGSSNPVFIFVSATYGGDLRKLFLCIKPRMISSVNECVEPSKPRQEENDYEDIYAPEPNYEDTYA